MFPLRDSIPSSRPPLITVTIILACAAAFIFELSMGQGLGRFLEAVAFVPARLFNPGAFDVGLLFNLQTIATSMFLHGGWLHLIGNMWFLWVFGDNIEDVLGHVRYVFFYLVCGGAAALGQAAIAPASTVPMIGASGAIAGVLGAYLVWFPWSRVKTFLFLGIFFTMVELPAPVFLVLWFVMQFFFGTLSLASAGAATGGVAFFAHIGGFVAGVVIAAWLRRSGRARPAPRTALRWE